jgi:uncharacterized protein YggE
MKQPVRSIVICSVGWGLCLPAGAADSPAKTERMVTVQGQGRLHSVPDQARLQIMVTEEGAKVDAVTQKVRGKMDAVLKVLKNQGIAEKDIQTQFYRVTPKVEWRDGRSIRNGYTVSNQVEVKIHDLKKVGTVLPAVQDAGANDISGPQFEFENSQELERQALALAMDDAKAKAAVLARSAGASVGDILTIQESSSFRPGPRPYMMKSSALAAAPATQEPIAAGEETMEASVSATFALK